MKQTVSPHSPSENCVSLCFAGNTSYPGNVLLTSRGQAGEPGKRWRRAADVVTERTWAACDQAPATRQTQHRALPAQLLTNPDSGRQDGYHCPLSTDEEVEALSINSSHTASDGGACRPLEPWSVACDHTAAQEETESPRSHQAWLPSLETGDRGLCAHTQILPCCEWHTCVLGHKKGESMGDRDSQSPALGNQSPEITPGAQS